MAVVKFINVKNYNLSAVLKYITRDDKTKYELKYGKDCSIDNAKLEFETVKKLYRKTDKRQYYHFAQSFSPKDNITPEIAYKVGVEFANYFKGYQLLMTTHIDKEHIHNHFVMNSVSFETGLKYHQSNQDLQNIKIFCNELCQKYGLRKINLKEEKEFSKYMDKNEYYAAKKQETEKKKLINTINKCIRKSKSKSQFIYNMNLLGYKVKWQDSRKYITYTTPLNLKFRDKRLQNEKYSKERMELYFKKVESKNKILNIVNKTSSILNNRGNINNTKQVKNNADISDIAKKDYLKSMENASSIEWE